MSCNSLVDAGWPHFVDIFSFDGVLELRKGYKSDGDHKEKGNKCQNCNYHNGQPNVSTRENLKNNPIGFVK